MTLQILYEDNHLIAVNKAAGTLTQGDSSGAIPLIDRVRNYIRKKYGKPGKVFLGMVQRLDRPVSGVIIFARTSKAAQRLNAAFGQRTIHKFYLALVENKKAADAPDTKWHRLTGYIKKRDGYPILLPSSDESAQTAELEYRTIRESEDYSLLLVELLTGRKHQIRLQLSAEGHHIAGDSRYGSREQRSDRAILLHSYYLDVPHPTQGVRVRLTAPPPVEMLQRVGADRRLLDEVDLLIEERCG